MSQPTEPGIPRLSRRALLKVGVGAGALLSLGLWPGALRAEDAGGGDFRFVVVNDTHCQTPECGDYFHQLALRIKQESPQFVLHAGDLTQTAESRWFGMLNESFQALDCPWYPVLGNHDYATQTDRTAYEKAFPDRINYAFEENGWQFVGLDTTDGLLYEKTPIQPPTLAWLDDNLRTWDQGKPTVVFTHFPMGHAKYRPLNADALLERFLDFNLQAVFCGHYHSFTESTIDDTPVTTNKCCSLVATNHDGTTDKGFFVCQATAGKLTRRFVEFTPS